MDTNLFIALEQDNTAALVTGCEIVACAVELDGGDDVRCMRNQPRTDAHDMTIAVMIFLNNGTYLL